MKRNKKTLTCLLLFCFIFSLVSVCAESASAMVGPVREWKFDEAGGTTATDTSGQGKHGTIAREEQRVVDETRGKVLEFAGAADAVQVPPSPFNNQANWTFSAYLKPTTIAGEACCLYAARAKDPAVPEDELIYFSISITADDRIKIETWHKTRDPKVDSYQTASGVITRGAWNYLHITLENATAAAQSGTVTCYVNGIPVAGDPPEGGLGIASV